LSVDELTEKGGTSGKVVKGQKDLKGADRKGRRGKKRDVGMYETPTILEHKYACLPTSSSFE